MKIYHTFSLTVDIEKTFHRLEYIYQQILFTKFHENVTLSGGVDSILGADSKTGSTLPPPRPDFHKTLQRVSAGEYLQVFRDFRYVLSK